LNSPVKKLLNAGEQIACGVTNGGTPQVASRPPEMAIHYRRRNIAKLGISNDDATQRGEIEASACRNHGPLQTAIDYASIPGS